MNRVLLTVTVNFLLWAGIQAANTNHDLRIELLDYYNLVIDHNIQTPNGASPRAVYIGVRICNDGTNELTDVFANIGNYATESPGVYPVTTVSSGPYTGNFSFTHEGGQKDATRFIGKLAPGECVMQYWLLSYPLLDANGNRVCGSKPDQTDDLSLRYDVWASGNDAGTPLFTDATKTVQCRAMISAMANKIWPNTTSKVPNELLAAFPDKQLGWRQTTPTAASAPGTSVVLEGIWFDLGNIRKGFDNNGDYIPDYNFLLQPVGNPALYDANCFRLLKVHGLIVIKLQGSGVKTIEFTDQMHFEDIPDNNTGAVGMIFYEFAVLNGPCSSQLTPYQEVASGSNNEKHNGDYGTPGGTLTAAPPSGSLVITTPPTVQVGQPVEVSITYSNSGTLPIGVPEQSNNLVYQATIPESTTYVAGSAGSNNSMPTGTTMTMLYSTDDGVTWGTSEPNPAATVTNIQWWLDQSLLPGQTGVVTFDVLVSATFSGPVVEAMGGVSIGNSSAFIAQEGNMLVQGPFSVTGKVFNDNGQGTGGESGDGIQNGTEAGLPNITVWLYVDENGNGKAEGEEYLALSAITQADGSYAFNNLTDASYVVKVNSQDSDLPTGLSNTSPSVVGVQDLDAVATPIPNGFGPLVAITNTLIGSSTVYENDIVTYQVTVNNQTYSEDDDDSCAATAWSSVLDPATNYNNSPNNILGPPDDLMANFNGNWTHKAVVKGFNVLPQPGAIEKVELVFQFYTDQPIANDKLQAKFTLGNGTTAVVPNPTWGKDSSPSLNDYVGASQLGYLTVDVSNLQDWSWSTFTPDWKVTLEGVQVGGHDGVKIWLDAIGVRVTSDCGAIEGIGEPGDCASTVLNAPISYTFNPTKLEYIGASETPTSTAPGELTWDNVGPLYPGQTKQIDLNFRALQPEPTSCALSAPECLSIPNAWTQCDIASSGYNHDKVVTGNVTWNSILSSVPTTNVTGSIRIKGTGTVTVPSGDLIFNASYFVLDGPTLIISNGNLKINQSASVLLYNGIARIKGNLEQVGDQSYLCVNNMVLEVGDEASNGYFNTSGSPTSANFSNDGGKRRLENVCLNVTRDFTLSSSGTSEDVIINTCAEIGDQGATNASTGTIDASDSGNFQTSKNTKIFSSEFVVVENINIQSGATLQACDSKFRTLNGNFSNSGTFKGCDNFIWVNDGKSITNSSVWTAVVAKRRGSSTLSTTYIPANSSVAAISPDYGHCSCTPINSPSDKIVTTVIVEGAKNCENQTMLTATDDEAITLLDKGSVSGIVFGDKDNDGWKGTTGFETGTDYYLPGVVVTLYGCVSSSGSLIYPAQNTSKRCDASPNNGSWSVIKKDTTDNVGSYRFEGLKNGYYYALVSSATVTSMLSQTADPDQTGVKCTSCDHMWKTSTGNLGTVGIIGAANDFYQVNFGYFLDEAISGTVYNDVDGNGKIEAADIPLPGVTVKRVSGGCTTACPTTVTNANGEYAFPGLTAGTSYTIQVVTTTLPTGGTWTETYESDGTINNSITQVLTAGTQSRKNDYGFNQKGVTDVSGTVYYDWHANGFINNGDEGIQGVVVNLIRDNNGNGVRETQEPIISTLITSVQGEYTFSEMPPGNYIISLNESSLPIFPYQTENPTESGICTTCDAQGAIPNVNGTTDQTNIDFGYTVSPASRPSATVEGIVYEDVDANSIRHFGENGLQGISVSLKGDMNGDGVFVELKASTSASNGHYTFDALLDGDYSLEVFESDGNLPLNYKATTVLFRTFTIAGGRLFKTDNVECGSCEGISLDFGFAPAGSIESYVFFDGNGNGTMDWTETGIPNVTVYRCLGQDVACTAANAADTVLTDLNGLFLFEGLRAGYHTVAVEVASLPAGLTLTADPSTDGIPCYSPLLFADPNYVLLSSGCDSRYGEVQIYLGSQARNVNFGYQPKGIIGDVVWSDLDLDGIQDSNEPGVANLEVRIQNHTSFTEGAITYPPGSYRDTTFTDYDGVYTFINMFDAMWAVEVVLPTNSAPTHDADGVLDNTTLVTISEGEVRSSGNTWCPPGEECSLDVTFGLRPDYPNSLTGTICLDADSDGQCDPLVDVVPNNLTVFAYSESGVLLGQTEADSAGNYSFDYLPNDTVIISLSMSQTPLQLTSVTTSTGDTPAFEISEVSGSTYQKVALTGDITGVNFAFAFTDTFDLGDLPLPYLTSVNGRSTGPAHLLDDVPTLYLGVNIDAEFHAVVTNDALGDDTYGDDEDGINFGNTSNWTAGTVASGNGGDLTAVVRGDGWLLGWADFNADGDFNEPGEMIIDQAVTTGTYNLDFDIPAGTDLSGGQEIYSRFRLFVDHPFSPETAHEGIVEGGEVEDYLITICRNLTSPGAIAGNEVGCNAFDPAAITESVPASGGGGLLEYRWQESVDDGLTWNYIAGATAASYDPPLIAQTTRYRRIGLREHCAALVYSNTIVKTVLTNFTDPGIIVGDEENCGIYDPGIMLNVVSPSGGSGTGVVSYQWEQSTDGGITWMEVATANKEFYDPGIISQTTKYRRASRKMPCGTFVYSNVITKMVAINFINAGTIAGNESICGSYDPGIITSTSLPSGGVDGYIGYQWERSIDFGNTWSVISGATGITYNPGAITQTTLYRRKARRVPCGIWVNSNTVTKEVRTIPTASITIFPTSATGNLCELTDYTYGAASAGAGVEYYWDFGPYATSPTGIGQGPINVQFDVPNGASTTTTTVTLTVDKDGCTVTDSKVINLRPEIVINSVTLVDPDACSANNGSITIMATYPPAATILYSVNGGATWTSSSFIDLLGAGVYDIRVRYSTSDCQESYGYVSLSDPPPAADLFVSSMEGCTGQAFTVNAVATSGSPTYTWFFGGSATPASATGPGPHNVTFSTGAPTTIAVQLEEAGCVGVTDTTLIVVENFTDGGTILGGGTLCSTYDPAAIVAGSNPAGGYGNSTLFGWEKRERTSPTTWGPWTNIAGANSAGYDPGTIAATTEFRRKARRNPCSSWIYSNTVTSLLMIKPQLGDDNYFTVCPGFPFADNVNINDFSLNNPSFNILVWPTNGTLDFENDGEILYVPNTTYCGTDAFKYFVCNDGTVCCDTANVVIDLTDIVPPTIANVPADVTISCDDQMPIAEAVSVVENCQNVSIGVDQFVTQGVDSCALYNYEFIRVWNGVDYCTNTAQAQQTITVADITSPDIYRIYTLPNGKRLVAGVMENVSDNWKSVALPVQFATKPIIFTQMITRNEPTAAVVRLRNVSTTQFQVSLQEEEVTNGVHQKESVAWIAMEKGAISGSVPFEVNSWLLTHASTTKSFGQMYPSAPKFIASVQTNNESDPVNVRFSNVTTTGVTIQLQEETSLDAETTHNLETVGYLAFQGATDLKTNTGEVFGEVGTVSVTESIVTVNLQHTYHNPVVVVGGTSYNDHSPVTVRVLDVTGNSFKVKLDEYDYQNGTHSVETMSFLVVEGSLPLDKPVSCDNIPQPLAIGTQIIAKDNCDATVQLKMTQANLDFDCSTDTVLTRIWYVVDDCGNETQLTERYILQDYTAPTFTVPANVTIDCGISKDNLAITGNVIDAHDNCAVEVFPVYTDDMTNLLGCNGYIFRTWSVEDDCGNITVKVQTITIAAPTDTDRDGVADYFDLDDDNDGIPDSVEGTTDFDGDGIPNSQDLDSDNDGIPDLIEIGRADQNGDGVVDIVGTSNWDHDHDGFAFGFDGNDINSSNTASSNFNPGSLLHDRDQDGIPNYLDRDSDNDGITDLIEIGGADVDGDGILDYPTLNDPLTMPDLDRDGFHDKLDSDDDGITGAEDTNDPFVRMVSNTYYGGLSTGTPDFDGDKVPNFLDSDSDNDGIPDLIEMGGVDMDGDGRLKLTGYFVDINQDGYFDIYAANALVRTEPSAPSGNMRPYDFNNNGTVFVQGDADFDGKPNYLDRDSDNDRIFDILETGLFARDLNSDGIIDNFMDTNLSGFDDLIEASGNIITEQDGSTLDGRPQDSGDADLTPYVSTQADGAFATANGNPDVDNDGDGKLNFLDIDSDNDLLLDEIEDSNFNGIVNINETSLYSVDTDNDGIRDGVEDRNQNGVVDAGETDPLNPNTDGDMLGDGEEDSNQDGIVDAGESNGIDPCDPYLSDACKGVAMNIRVKLLGPLVGVNDTLNIMRDQLREKLVLPTTEPYTKLANLNHIGVPLNPNSGPGTGGTGTTGNADYKEFFSPGLLYVTGLDAPVDWVLVELRTASQPDSVVATRAGILQADGDIRDIDGQDYLRFGEMSSGNYFVSVRHRNHLGVMTQDPYLLSPALTQIDFTDPDLPVYGIDSRRLYNGEMTFWPGDFNNDGKVVYQGPANDVTYLFQSVLLHPTNNLSLANFIVQGYKSADLNLDGNSIYQGPNNDRAMLLLNSILSSPMNTLHLANYILHEKLP